MKNRSLSRFFVREKMSSLSLEQMEEYERQSVQEHFAEDPVLKLEKEFYKKSQEHCFWLGQIHLNESELLQIRRKASEGRWSWLSVKGTRQRSLLLLSLKFIFLVLLVFILFQFIPWKRVKSFFSQPLSSVSLISPVNDPIKDRVNHKLYQTEVWSDLSVHNIKDFDGETKREQQKKAVFS